MDNLCHEKLALEGVGEGLSGDGRPQDEEGGARVTNKKNRLGCKRKRAFSCPLHASLAGPLQSFPFQSICVTLSHICHIVCIIPKNLHPQTPKSFEYCHSLVSFYHSPIRTRTYFTMLIHRNTAYSPRTPTGTAATP